MLGIAPVVPMVAAGLAKLAATAAALIAARVAADKVTKR